MDNSNELLREMTDQEKEVFNFDAAKLDWDNYLLAYGYGLRVFALGEKGLKKPTAGNYLIYKGLSLDRKPFADFAFALKVTYFLFFL